MYEFIPKKRSGVAPIWFILVAVIALLVGANITFYFVKNAVQDGATTPKTITITPTPQPAGQSPLGGALTPSATPTVTKPSDSITPTVAPSPSPTSTI